MVDNEKMFYICHESVDPTLAGYSSCIYFFILAIPSQLARSTKGRFDFYETSRPQRKFFFSLYIKKDMSV